MPHPAKDDDGFEWTIHEELPAEAPLPPLTTTPSPPRRLGWPARALAGLVIALVAAAPWLWTRWEWRQAEAAITAQLAAAPPTPPAPPVGGLRPIAGAPAALPVVTWLGPGRARADLAFGYLTPTDATVTFRHPFFFEEVDGRWRPMPTSDPGEARTLRYPHLEIDYYMQDAALVEGDLAPWLAPLIARACEAWACLPEVTARVDLISERPEPTTAPVLADEPLLYQLLRTERTDLPTLPWPSGAPARTGRPDDAAARDLWRRAVGVRALTSLGHMALGPAWADTPPDSPFFYALVARLAARLGLDAETARLFAPPPEQEREAALLRGSERPRTINTGFAPADRRAALALLNRYFAAHPQANEAAMFTDLTLFYGLDTGMLSWLARHSAADGLSLAEFNARWQAFLPAAETPPPLPASADLALSCAAGPRLMAEGRWQSIFPFTAASPLAWPFINWAPDGRRLALGLGLSTVVLDLDAETLYLVEPPGLSALSVPVAWVSDTQLAYYALPAAILARGEAPAPEAFELRFHDLADPARVFPPVTGVPFPLDNPLSYHLSPDRTLALVSDQDGALAVMPALGGARTPLVAAALAAAWAADGQRVVVAHWDEATQGVQVALIETATQTQRVLWDSAAYGLAFTHVNELWVRLEWAPGDGPVALAINQRGAGVWAGLVPMDGRPAQAFADGPATVNRLAFSPDGAFLAIGGSPDEAGLWLYTLATATLQGSASGFSTFDLAWSPAGDQLLINGSAGLRLLSEVDSGAPQLAPVSRAEEVCGAGQWRPQP